MSNDLNTTDSVDVNVLAEWLVLTPRRVQQLEKKGITVKDAHGEWQLKISVQNYIREMNAKADGKNSKYHQERTKLMEIKRKDAELDYLERARQLGNVDEIQRVIEKAKAAERQQVLFMPKQMAPRLDGDPAVNEALLDEWGHEFLKGQTEINLRADITAPPAPDMDQMPELPKKKRAKKK